MSRPIVLGALGGVAAGFGVWFIVSKLLDKQFDTGSARLRAEMGSGSSELRSQMEAGRVQMQAQIRDAVRREVPPVVRSELTSTLNDFGLTPATGRQITRILTNAERIGLVGVRY